MLPEKEYIKFSRKVAKMAKTCLLYTKRSHDEIHLLKEEFGVSSSEVSLISGACSLTQDYIYCFNIAEALKHKDKLLAICASLPKMNTVVTGTAGSIAYTDLLPDRKTDPISLKQHCEHADKFIGLLTINRIGAAKEISGSGSFKAAPIDLAYKYKDQVYLNID